VTPDEYRTVAIVSWLIAAIFVGLFVGHPDLPGAIAAVVACAGCGAATYEWLRAEQEDRGRWW